MCISDVHTCAGAVVIAVSPLIDNHNSISINFKGTPRLAIVRVVRGALSVFDALELEGENAGSLLVRDIGNSFAL